MSATLPQAGAATEARGRAAEARDAEGHRAHAGAKATAPTFTPRPTPKPAQEVDIHAVPADVVQAARDSFNGRAPGTRIAGHVYDSLTDGSATAATFGGCASATTTGAWRCPCGARAIC